MKKLFILSASIILLIATSNNKLFAQDSKHDISLSYGVFTNDEFIDFFSDALTAMFTLGYRTTDNIEELGGIFITYKNIAHKFNWGITAGYDAILSSDVKDKDTLVGKAYSNRITIALEGDYRYINKDFFQMYSGLGVGYSFRNDTYKPNLGEDQEKTYNMDHFNFQLTAVGVRFGKSFGGFMELGFGYKGILNFGLSYQF